MSVPAEKVSSEFEPPAWVQRLIADELKPIVEQYLADLPDQIKSHIDEVLRESEKDFDVNEMAEFMNCSAPTVWRRAKDPNHPLGPGRIEGARRVWSASERRIYRAAIEARR